MSKWGKLQCVRWNMKKLKQIATVLLALCCVFAFAACGASDGNTGRKGINTSDEDGTGRKSDKNSDGGNTGMFSANGDNNSDSGNKEGKPKFKLVLFDDTHADFILEKDSLVDIKFKDMIDFTFYFPDQLQFWYSPQHAEGETSTVLFHEVHAGLGAQELEETPTEAIWHLKVEGPPIEDEKYWDPGTLAYVQAFNFANFSGTCTFYYNVPGDFTHSYEYDYSELLNTDNYVASSTKDRSSELVGVWCTDKAEVVDQDSDGTWRGYMIASFYIFYADGTCDIQGVKDHRGSDGKYYSVEDNFDAWYAGRSSGGTNTYYYDGETLTLRSDKEPKQWKTTVSGNTLTIGSTEYKKYTGQ